MNDKNVSEKKDSTSLKPYDASLKDDARTPEETKTGKTASKKELENGPDSGDFNDDD